jgi:Zn-dependent protease with chaperone function
VVMTDQLVALARSDRELLGVLAHESGHVTHRHGLAGVYQALGLTLLTTVVTGDLVSAGTFAAAAPAALLQRGYSRAAETQADEVAGAFMLEKYRTTRPLRDILARLENKDAKADESSVQSGNRIEDLLQSHPGTANRIEHLRALEQAAK